MMGAIWHLFFDLTAAGGWNGVAIITYASLTILAVAAWMERGRK